MAAPERHDGAGRVDVPARAATRITVSGYTDTVGYAVSNGDMTARHAARMLADA